MTLAQERFDDAMADFSMGEFDVAIGKLESLLAEEPDHFDSRLALGMAYCRKGNYAVAIVEGHKAEALRPKDPLVHTNLSLFYVKQGDKEKAEHHGLQARIASWRDAGAPPNANPSPGAEASELDMAQPKPKNLKFSGKLPDMPWKKKPPASGEAGSAGEGKTDQSH